jgi:hypothetical protein
MGLDAADGASALVDQCTPECMTRATSVQDQNRKPTQSFVA